MIPSRIAALCGGVQMTPSRTTKTFSPEPSETTAVLVEQDRLVVAGVGRLGLGQHRVEVLAGGLRVRDQAVAGDRPPGGDLGADAVPRALLAEVDAPGEGGDDHVDRRVGRVEAEVAVTAVGERPDIAGAEPVAADQLVRRLAQLLRRVGQLEVVELGRLLEPREVLAVAEDGGAALGLIAADPLEDAGAVVQAVAEHVRPGLVPGHELAVLPDQLSGLHRLRSMPARRRSFHPCRRLHLRLPPGRGCAGRARARRRPQTRSARRPRAGRARAAAASPC